jgi:hypothetical protein
VLLTPVIVALPDVGVRFNMRVGLVLEYVLQITTEVYVCPSIAVP